MFHNIIFLCSCCSCCSCFKFELYKFVPKIGFCECFWNSLVTMHQFIGDENFKKWYENIGEKNAGVFLRWQKWLSCMMANLGISPLKKMWKMYVKICENVCKWELMNEWKMKWRCVKMCLVISHCKVLWIFFWDSPTFVRIRCLRCVVTSCTTAILKVCATTSGRHSIPFIFVEIILFVLCRGKKNLCCIHHGR